MQIILGSRGSKLALWQTHQVQRKLEKAGIDTRCHIVKTSGDLVQNKPLHQLGTVGIFTKALDLALQTQEIDLAIHSGKDMPALLDEDLEIFAFLKREDPRDVLLANSAEISLENYTQKWRIGTSSMRRSAFLKYYMPSLIVKDIRGNIDSRIQKLDSGEYDAIILAYAGVKRMGFESFIVQKLSVATFTPAVAQGAIAIVGRKDSPHKAQIKQILNHETTASAVKAERSFLHTVAGGCSIPVFGLATVIGTSLTLTGGMANQDASHIYRHTVQGNEKDGIVLGKELGEIILKQTQSIISN